MNLFTNIFKAPVAVSESPYRECRSWYGISFHIRDKRDKSRLALCGYDFLDEYDTPLTLERYTARAAHQHENWKYCQRCAEKFEQAHKSAE